MPYDYEEFRSWILTDEGQRALLRVRDEAARLGSISGAFIGARALGTCRVPDSWKQLSLLDRLVEIGDLRKMPGERSDVYELAGSLERLATSLRR